MKLKPLHNQVLVQEILTADIVIGSGGLHIKNKGRVLEVGPDVKTVKVDDVVIIDSTVFLGIPTHGLLDNKKILIVEDSQILAVIEDYQEPSSLIPVVGNLTELDKHIRRADGSDQK